MGAQGQKKEFALDSNILFDLAAEKDFAHTFREGYQERGYSLKVPPTVVQELTYYALEKKCAKTPLASVLVLLGLERDCNHVGDCLINDLVLQHQQSKRAEDAAFLWLENHGCG